MYHPAKFSQDRLPYTFMYLHISASPSSPPSPSLHTPPFLFYPLPPVPSASLFLPSSSPSPSNLLLSRSILFHLSPYLPYHFIPTYYFSTSIRICIYDMWHVAYGIWHVTCGICHIGILEDAVSWLSYWRAILQWVVLMTHMNHITE